ncbi:hypothetical protein L1987_54925 [Smallanthus sonchifolius]|uniref:Uncharacterized protein n=1 Tax=Smallanthus sonchifolius TaxID=185202 RepID=A0ACB9E8F3_9ASTR|nr:hypothetical protein L1987_54925 [Smallanthus sonchifolius]
MGQLISGGYTEDSVSNAWNNIAFEMGNEEIMGFELKTIYALYLEGIENFMKSKKLRGEYEKDGFIVNDIDKDEQDGKEKDSANSD